MPSGGPRSVVAAGKVARGMERFADATKCVPLSNAGGWEMNLPQRKMPIRQTPVISHNRSVILVVTVCTAGRRAILAREDVHRLLCEIWQEADQWWVGRYVIMPDHVHLFCAPVRLEMTPVERWVTFWKSRASQRWPRRHEQPVWQKSFWDTQLRRGKSYDAKWEYVRANPVRHGFVLRAEDWPYQGERHVLDWHD